MTDVLTKIHQAAEIYTGMHFVYTSGEHGDGYVDLRALGRLPSNAPIVLEAALLLLKRIIANAGLDPAKPITVIGPQTLGAEMVRQLWYAPKDELKEILPDPSKLDIRILKNNGAENGYSWDAAFTGPIDPHTQVVFMDDMLNAGSTYNKARMLVEQDGGTIVAVGVIGDRSGQSASDLRVRHIDALERFEFRRFSADDCPLCKKSVPIVLKPGHGVEFKEAHPEYAGGFVRL